MARRARQFQLPLKADRPPHPGSVFERSPGNWYIRVRLGQRLVRLTAPAETRFGAEQYLDLVRQEYARSGRLPLPQRAVAKQAAPVSSATPEPALL